MTYVDPSLEEREGRSGEDDGEGEIKERLDTDDRERELKAIKGQLGSSWPLPHGRSIDKSTLK